MNTLADSPAVTTEARPITRKAAMKFMAKGHTSASLADLADKTAAPPDFLLAASAAVGALEAEGVTAADCWDLFGWTPEFVEWILTETPALAVPSQRAASGALSAA